MKKHFSRNLIISEKEEHLFQQSNSCKKLTKYLSCFGDKWYVLDDEIYTLAYFHKDSVTTCKEI